MTINPFLVVVWHPGTSDWRLYPSRKTLEDMVTHNSYNSSGGVIERGCKGRRVRWLIRIFTGDSCSRRRKHLSSSELLWSLVRIQARERKVRKTTARPRLICYTWIYEQRWLAAALKKWGSAGIPSHGKAFLGLHWFWSELARTCRRRTPRQVCLQFHTIMSVVCPRKDTVFVLVFLIMLYVFIPLLGPWSIVMYSST